MRTKSQIIGKNRGSQALITGAPLAPIANELVGKVSQSIPAARHPIEISSVTRDENLEISEIRKSYVHPSYEAMQELSGFIESLLDALDSARQKGISFRNAADLAGHASEVPLIPNAA